MKTRATRKEIVQNFPKVYYLPQMTGYEISRYLFPSYYTCGKYGWNCDVFVIGNGIALTYGNRPFGEKYPEEELKNLTKKLDNLNLRYDVNAIDFKTMIEKARETINEFFLA